MEIEATSNTPYFKLDEENCTLTFKGRLYPEHPIIFYKPIFDEVMACLDHIGGKDITINLALEIMNSVSAKYLYILVKDINESAKQININWYYEEDDEDMEEEGQQFISTFGNINFKLIPVEDILNFTK